MNTQNSFLGNEEIPPYVPSSDEKTWGMLAHLITIISSFIAPLIIYLIKKDESEFVSYQAKESLNFQITLLLIYIILFITVIGIFLMWIVGIINLVLVIVAGIRASEGKLYRYPFNIRFIK
ncbi:MAG: DUF4870 domain-containing protein [Arachidicoccus sp.]|nr:DUF4870 domain-containing protein [Arachidicoccus sp.]